MPDLATYAAIWEETVELGFPMASDKLTGSLLRTLAASKPGGVLLELGTGTGLGTSSLLDGMNNEAKLITVENEPAYLAVACKYLGDDLRLDLRLDSGENVIDSLLARSIDFIFADTWPGKYHYLEKALDLLKTGGIYFIDDMLPQENWPPGHAQKAEILINQLENTNDMVITHLKWSTGIILAVKI